jgi:hypothetical protein
MATTGPMQSEWDWVHPRHPSSFNILAPPLSASLPLALLLHRSVSPIDAFPAHHNRFDALLPSAAYQENLASFLDQRNFLANAVSALGNLSIAQEIQAELQSLVPVPVTAPPPGSSPFDPASHGPFTCAGYNVTFDDTGAIVGLLAASGDGPEWASNTAVLSRLVDMRCAPVASAVSTVSTSLLY